MFTWRTIIHQYKSISWLLVAAILLLTILPAHLHLHHVDTSDSHAHVIDLHFVAENLATEHHDDATVLPTTPDVLIKKANDNPLLTVALIILAGFLLPIAISTLQRRLNSNNHIPAPLYTISPPLRAPPLY